jgi:dsRNA-specific ribonuclease
MYYVVDGRKTGSPGDGSSLNKAKAQAAYNALSALGRI